MTRRHDDPTRRVTEHGTLSIAAYQRYENLKKWERDLRLAEKDAQYKKALGIDVAAELPKALGTAGGTRTGSYKGVRATKRLA